MGDMAINLTQKHNMFFSAVYFKHFIEYLCTTTVYYDNKFILPQTSTSSTSSVLQTLPNSPPLYKVCT